MPQSALYQYLTNEEPLLRVRQKRQYKIRINRRDPESRRRISRMFIEGKSPEGALVIVKKMSKIRQFAIVLDKSKGGRWGFVFGGMHDPLKNVIDRDIFATAMREVPEEIFYKMDVLPPFEINDESVLDILHKKYGYKVTGMQTQVPAGAKIVPGEEQAEAKWVTAKEIDALIEKKEFLRDHAYMWQLYVSRDLHQ